MPFSKEFLDEYNLNPDGTKRQRSKGIFESVSRPETILTPELQEMFDEHTEQVMARGFDPEMMASEGANPEQLPFSVRAGLFWDELNREVLSPSLAKVNTAGKKIVSLALRTQMPTVVSAATQPEDYAAASDIIVEKALYPTLRQMANGATKLAIGSAKAGWFGLKMFGAGMSRINKFATGAVAEPIFYGSKLIKIGSDFIDPYADVDWGEIDLTGMFMEAQKARVKSLRAAIPIPGFADDVPTFGELMAGTYYETVSGGQKAPWWYAPTVDISSEIAAGALMTKIGLFSKLNSFAGQAPLTGDEIRKITSILPAEDVSKLAKTPNGRVAVRQILSKQKTAITIKHAMDAADEGTDLGKAKESLIDLIKKARDVQKEANLSRKADYSKVASELAEEKHNVARAADVIKEGIKTFKTKLKGKGKAGSLDLSDFELSHKNVIAKALLESEDLTEFERYRGLDELNKFFETGKIPGKAELGRWEKVLGKRLVDEIRTLGPKGHKAFEAVLDTMNIPRTTLTMGELSAAFRQGGWGMPLNPKKWAKSFGSMLRTAMPGKRGEAWAKYLDDFIKRDPDYGFMVDQGLFFAHLDDNVAISKRSEEFLSRYAEAIPGVKWSKRTHQTFINRFRYELGKEATKSLRKIGATESDYRAVYKYINASTGRGDFDGAMRLLLGSEDAKVAEFITSFGFAPRYTTSRFQIPMTLFSESKHARQMALKDLFANVSLRGTILGLAKWNGAEVETDPRSTDFGKIKVGDTRVDIWAGESQMARFLVQLATGQHKTQAKDVIDAPRYKVVEKFIRTKLAPGAALVADATIFGGRDILGREVNLTWDELWKRTGPLWYQDILDMFDSSKVTNFQVESAMSGFLGDGVQTYEVHPSALVRLRQKEIAEDYFGTNKLEDLDLEQALLLEAVFETDPQLKQFGRTARYESDYNFEFHSKTLRDSQKKITKKLSPEVAKILEETETRVNGVTPNIDGWELNDERYEKYQSLIAESIDAMVTSIGSEKFLDMPPEARDEMIRAARSQAVAEMLRDALK